MRIMSKKFCNLKYQGSLAIFLCALLCAVATANASVVGSHHDLSNSINANGEVCIPCHTPHNADDQIIPLWNHQTTISVFVVYSSSSLDAVIGQPSGVSLACLSCHDGVLARDAFGGKTSGSYGPLNSNRPSVLSEDLTNDHPVSFVYDEALATTDGYLATPQNASTVDGDLPLFSGSLECSTCHDVHNMSGLDNNFMRVTNGGSALCKRCHLK